MKQILTFTGAVTSALLFSAWALAQFQPPVIPTVPTTSDIKAGVEQKAAEERERAEGKAKGAMGRAEEKSKKAADKAASKAEQAQTKAQQKTEKARDIAAGHVEKGETKASQEMEKAEKKLFGEGK